MLSFDKEIKYFVANDNNTVKLYKALFGRSVFTQPQTIVPAVSPPATLFPSSMQLGDNWEITADCFRGHPLGDCEYKMNFEVVAIEDVATKAGDFKNCLKIKWGDYSYLWLAPNVGPVQYSNLFTYELFRYTANLPSATTVLPPDPQPAVVNPPRQPRAGANYFPLDIGNRWVLSRHDDSETITYTVESAGEASDYPSPIFSTFLELGDLSGLKLLKKIEFVFWSPPSR